MYRGYNGFGYGYAGFPWGWLVIGIALFVVVAGIVYIAVKLGKSKSPRAVKLASSGAEVAGLDKPNTFDNTKGLEILAERYARGEIDAETYKAMKQELQS